MTVYYVDNSSSNASDTNAGTSVDAPLLSLAAVSALALHAGDSVEIKAGTVYSGASATALLTISASGTADHSITITSYGAGAPPIIANTSNSTYGDAIDLKSASYVTISGLDFTQSARAAVNINAGSSHITVSGNEMTNVGEGVLVAGHDNLVTQNYMHDLHMVVNTPTSVNSNDDYGANGVVISGSNNDVSYNRIVKASAASYDYGTDGGGVEIFGTVSDVNIHDNYVQNSAGFIEAGGPTGSVITNVTVSNNISLNNGNFATVHNSGGAFSASVTNFDITHNTIVNQTNNATEMSTIFIDGSATGSQIDVSNNIIFLNNGDSVFKQTGNYHSDNLIYLQSSTTHLYNNWTTTLGTGEAYGNPNFANAAAGDFTPTAAGLAQTIGASMSAADMALLPAADAASSAINQPPVVTGFTSSVLHGTTLNAGALFTAADPNGSAITEYQIIDRNTSVTSTLMLKDVAQGHGQIIDLTPAQLSALSFTAGFGSDSLLVRAFDGSTWSGWGAVTVTGTNTAPIITTANQSLSHGTVISAANLFHYADADGDAAALYQVIDNTTTTGGHFVLNGVAQADGQTLELTADQLKTLSFQAGVGADSLQIKAYDGGAWSNVATLAVSGTNAAPIVMAAATALTHHGLVAASSLFSVSDADKDGITQYQVIDRTGADDSGHFLADGVAVTAGQTQTLTAAQLTSMTFAAGSGSDAIQIRAFDGTTWGNWASVTVTAPVNAAPVVVAANQTVVHGTTLAASSLMAVTDADKDAITEYQLLDNNTSATGGTFVLNSVATAAGQTVDLTAAQFSQLKLVAGSGTDIIQIRAFDGLNWSPWTATSVVGTNHAPLVTAANDTLAHNATVSAASLFSAADQDGDAVTSYQIVDLNAAADSGAFVLNGVTQAAGQVIQVTAAQLSQLVYQSGSGSNQINIRASDGSAWGAWSTITAAAPVDHAPVVTGLSQTVTRGALLDASTLLKVTDTDGDAITQYQVIDYTTSASSGAFVLNGVAQAAGQTITLTADQFAHFKFQAALGNDTLQIRAFDGLDWSGWGTVTVTGVDHAPVVATSSSNVAHGSMVKASSLFSATDSDGDAIVEYQLVDITTTAGSGALLLNGAVKGANQTVDVTAAQLAQLTFQAGSGTDQIKVRAYDGTMWGAWTTVSVTAPADHVAVVTATNVAIAPGATVNARTLFTVADADADSVTQYQIVDYTPTATSGHFVVNGAVLAANQAVTLTAAQLAHATYVAGSTSDSLSVRAFDGSLWGAWTTMSVVPTNVHAAASAVSATPIMADSAPVLVTGAPLTTTHGANVALSSLVSASDVDGDNVVLYQVLGMADDTTGGHIVVNGIAQAANQTVTITAAQLAQTTFAAGSGTDTLQIRASDGMMWSAWANATVVAPTDHAPVVQAATLQAAHGGSLSAASLFSTSDADGDAITSYQIIDLGNGTSQGHLVVNGVAQTSNTTVTLTAAQLAQTSFQSGSGSDHLQIRASDGLKWSDWQTATITAPSNHAPVVAGGPDVVGHGTTVAAASLFLVSDADGDATTQYQVIDRGNGGQDGGHLIVDGTAVAAGTSVIMTAEQLAHTTYQSGSGNETLTIRAFDGTDWGAWSNIVVQTPVDHAPVVTASNVSFDHGTTVAATSLFSVSDADSDAITQYQIIDGSTNVNSGHLTLQGHDLSGNVTVNAAQLASLTYTVGSTAADTIQVRALDGLDWSSWKSFTVTPTNAVPTVGDFGVNVAAKATVAMSSLFSVSDPNHDVISQYQLVDYGAASGAGHITANGADLASGQAATLTADQYAAATVTAGSLPGHDTVQVRASDGLQWSAWHVLHV